MIYIIFFSISIIFAYWAQKSRNAITTFLTSVVAIMIPAFLAGVRDLGIGTDTWTYVNYVYSDVLHMKSFSELIENQLAGNFGEIEMGYVLLNYFTTIFGTDFHWIYFTTNVVFLSVCYWCIFRRRKTLSVSFAWIILLFFYYNLCLNMVRQSIAISFCLAAQCMFEEKKYKMMLLFAVLALISHGTGAMVFVSVAILWILPYIIDKLGTRKVLFLTFCISVLFVLGSQFFISYLLNIGIFNDRYANYLILAQQQGEGAFQTTYVLCYLLFLYTFYYAYRHVKNNTNKRKILAKGLFFYLAIVLFCCSAITYHAFRMSLYFMMISSLIYYPEQIKLISLYKYNVSMILSYTTIVLSVVVWWYNIIYKGIHETSPYSSEILNSILF